MPKKTKTTKKRKNMQDATLKNIRSLKRRVEALETWVKEFTKGIEATFGRKR